MKIFFYVVAIIALLVYIWQIVGGYFSQINIISSLSPLFIGIAIAYLFAPVVHLLERFKIKRWIALILVFVLFLFILFIIGQQIVPVLIANFNELAATLPPYATTLIREVYSMRIEIPGFDIESALSTLINQGISIASQFSQSIAVNLLSMLTNSFSFIMNLLLGIFISFYCIMDEENILRSCYNLFPERHRPRVKEYVAIIDSVLSKYIRGLLIMVVILGAMTYIAMAALNVRYAVVAAIIVGILKVVPIIGAWVGLIPVLLFALLDSPGKALGAAIVYFIIQQLDGSVITPKVMGKGVGVHPIAVIVGIFVFGKIFGITGMLLAVPIMGIVKLCYVKIRYG